MFAFPYGSSGLSSGSSFVDLFNPQSGYAGYYDRHWSNQAKLQRARQLQLRQQHERQVKEVQLRELARREEMVEAYESAQRAERAGRLAESRYSNPFNDRDNGEDEEEKVQVQLPNGLRYIVPASWVERLRIKYGKQAAQRQPLPRRWRTPSPLEDVDVLTSVQEEDGHVRLDVPVQKHAATFRVPLSTSETAASAQVLASDPREPVVDEEARDVERRLDQLASLSSRLSSLRSAYETFPRASALVFSAHGKLAYNISSNKPFQEYEQALERLLPEIDGVEVRGYEEVRTKRKALVRGVEGELEKLDRHRQEAWEQLQRQEELAVMTEEKDSSKMDVDVTVASPESATTPEPVSQETAAGTTVSEEAETSSRSAIMDTATEDGDVDIDEAVWDLVDDDGSEGMKEKEVGRSVGNPAVVDCRTPNC